DLTYQTGGTGKSRLKKVSKSGNNQWGTEAYDDLDFGYSDFNTSWILPGGTGIDLDLKFKSALVDSSPCGTGDAACLCTLSGPCMAGWSQAQSICAQYAFANIIYGYSQSQSDMCHNGIQNKIKYTAAVDIDGDGKTDFARLVGDEANNSIRIKVRRDLAGSNADTDSGFNVPFHYNIFYSFADINGDGKTDFAFQDGNNKLAVAFGNGSAFNSPVAMNQITLDTRQTDISTWGGHKGNDLFGDIDGDGRADFVHFANNVHRVYLSTGNGFDGGRDIGFATPDKLENPQLVDMNGDGRADFVHIGNNDQIYVYSYNINTNAPSVQYGISDRGRSEYRWFVDVNGDGRPDFVRLIGKTIKVSLFTGSGFTGPYDSDFSAMSLDVNQLIDGDQASQVGKIHFDFGDFNGDGKTDIVYNDTYQGRTSGEIHYSNGTGFYYVGGSAGSFSDDRFSHAADVNGDGRADRVSFYDTNGTVVARYSTVSASDLLTSVSGSFGKTININYSLSGQVGGFNAGSGGYPDLPNVSPDFLVTSISENHGGGISENSTYAYSNNRFYSGTPNVREGLGFAYTRATNATTGFYQDTYFSQNKPYNGAVVRSVSYNPSGNRMSDTNIAYSNSAPFGTTFVFQTAVTEESLDNGNSLVIKSSSLSYDGFGNVDSTTESIGPRTTVINTTTNNDTTNWIIGRPTKITKAVNGTLVDDQRFTYTANDATFIQKLSGAGLAGTTINYDQFGNATSITNALGATTMMQYDGVVNKFVTQMTNAKGQTISSSYDTDLGVVTTSTDPMGIVTTKAYDAYGRVNSITSGAYNETYQYQFTGDPTQQFVEKRVTDDSSNGYIWTRVYQDALGRTVKNESEGINGNVITETFQFDTTTGRLMQKSNSYLAGMEGPLFYNYQYNDPDGKQTNVTNPDGSFVSIAYNGLSVTTTDQAGTTTTEVSDQDGVTLSRTTNGLTTSYGYDNARRMNRITAPAGSVTMLNYNSGGQRISQSDSNSGTTTYSYDQLGNVVSTTDARGVQINTSYDSLNRVAQVSGSNGESTTYSYDGSGYTGRLTSVTENHPGKTPSTEQYKYDAAGRLYESLRSIDDLAVIFRTKYDSMNRVSVVTYPDGTKLNHVYADSGHLTGITMDSADGTSVGHPVVSYQGPTANQSLIRQTGNGVKTEISYNPANLRPTAYTTTLADGSVNQNIAYTYDIAGNITAITDNIYLCLPD
ncbi:MAG: FG-GAP-like repeat-containing protein, partial [Leptospira sp.]|nr:FG-GAP-like repeat-containing protein [Leptospira sp.]